MPRTGVSRLSATWRACVCLMSRHLWLSEAATSAKPDGCGVRDAWTSLAARTSQNLKDLSSWHEVSKIGSSRRRGVAAPMATCNAQPSGTSKVSDSTDSITKSSFHRPNLWQHTSASPRAPVLTRPAAREQPVESWWYPGPAREARSRSAAACKIAGSCSTSLSSSLRAPTATGVGVSPRRVREPRVLFVSGAPRRFANHQWASGKPTQPLVGAARPSGPPHPGQSTPIIAIGRGAVVIVVGD